MTNRERIKHLESVLCKADDGLSAGVVESNDLAVVFQSSAASSLLVIATILDEMNEREKAREVVTEQGVAKRMLDIFMDTPFNTSLGDKLRRMTGTERGEDDAP